ncbi:MAG: L,D-transpeptidase [Beijerinckiaceae bacterium]|nr:L,D-transpeptidase [Beijerinckiaceae bacterium]
MSLAARFARLTFVSASLAFISLNGGVQVAYARPVEPASAGRVVSFIADYPPGTIVISQRERRLYLTLGDGRAIRYPVAVGKTGKAWSGWARVDGKHVNPAWAPPPVVKRDNPNLPDLIPGGSPSNPMGPRALTLDRSEIAIHGTTQSMRRSIGSAASYGCIRMYNEDIVDLFDRVRVGTAVVAVP